MKQLKFAILGGDLRQIALLKELKKENYFVQIYGFNSIKTEQNLDEILKNSNFIVFPLPISRNSKNLYAPFSNSPIFLNDIICNRYLKNKNIFMPEISSDIKNKLEKNNIFNYCTENFLVINAKLTSAAAIKIAVNKLKFSLKEANVLVCGFGRLGKALAKNLKNNCRNLVVSARKEEDFLKIKELGMKKINTANIFKTTGYDLIFNTIPACIFDYNTLKTSAKNSILIDLASLPGGVDKKSVKILNINYTHALGLPGKYYPEESGKNIKNSVLQIIKENQLDYD